MYVLLPEGTFVDVCAGLYVHMHVCICELRVCVYIYKYIYHHQKHHHTVQVARSRVQVRYLRQWLEGKTPPEQVPMGETTICASGVFVQITDGETAPP